MAIKAFICVAVAAGICACSALDKAQEVDAWGAAGGDARAAQSHRIPQAWGSVEFPGDNIDSLALWRDGAGGGRLFVTAKEGDRILVLDGLTGKLLRELGGRGRGVGEFRRPNGVLVLEDMLIVVERDNRRVQAFELPSLKPALAFGDDALKLPYGVTGWVAENGDYELYITDDYEMAGAGPGNLAKLGERVKHYRMRRGADGWRAELARSFGETANDDGALYVVESIQEDHANGRLLIADEPRRAIMIYDLEGRFIRRWPMPPGFDNDPEGIALMPDAKAPEGGYIVLTEQGEDETTLHVMSRGGTKYYGAVTGEPKLANTDGITLSPGDFGAAFQGGAIYAVNDDLTVQSYSWGEVARALGLQ